jgi:TRAP-type C4-dicarboxylate transport system substrate-binding protein
MSRDIRDARQLTGPYGRSVGLTSVEDRQMQNRRNTLGALAMATMVVAAGCAAAPISPTASQAPTGTSSTASPPPTSVVLTDQPVTLQLAVSDDPTKPSGAAANKFVNDVVAASNGNITIVPTFDAGKGTAKRFELGVAELVQSGQADLAVVSARAWDLAGVTSLQALQAPYLIDNDALLLAVAQSDIAQRSLDAMGAGVVGLTMWPEDLRHLFSFPSCPRDFRSPEGVSGVPFLWQPSGLTRELMEGLGAVEYVEDDRYLDAASCKLQGQENGLDQVLAMAMNDAVGVGNVTLFPKYQVLVANQASWDHLSDSQRQILLDAAAGVKADVIARHPTDAALAVAWCAQGGSVLVASEEQRQAFVATADPIYARLETDPLTKQLIADIRTLKGSTPASAGTVASACVGGNAFVPEPTSATSDGVGFSGEVPPNGTFRAELTYDGLIAQGATPEWARGNAGVWTWTYLDGRFHTDQYDLSCDGTYRTVDGKYFHMEVDADQSVNCVGGDFVWKHEADGIRLATLHIPAETSAQDYWDIFRWIDRIWIKIG